MGNIKNKTTSISQMKFAALVATAAALRTPNLPKASMAQKFGKKGLNMAQIKTAVGSKATQDDDWVEEVFSWFDRDGSGAIDVYEFIFGIGWICGYYVYEPTEEDLMMMEQFWWDCDTDMNGELSLDEVYAYYYSYY